MKIFVETLWRSLLSKCSELHDIYGKLIRLLRNFILAEALLSSIKSVRESQNKKDGCCTHKILQMINRLIKLLTCQHSYLYEKEEWLRERMLMMQLTEPKITEEYSQENGLFLLGIFNLLMLVTPLYLPFSPLWMEMSITIILCLTNRVFCGHITCFWVSRVHMWRIVPQDGDHTHSLTHTWFRWFILLDLGLLSWENLDEILDFAFMLQCIDI